MRSTAFPVLVAAAAARRHADQAGSAAVMVIEDGPIESARFRVGGRELGAETLDD